MVHQGATFKPASTGWPDSFYLMLVRHLFKRLDFLETGTLGCGSIVWGILWQWQVTGFLLPSCLHVGFPSPALQGARSSLSQCRSHEPDQGTNPLWKLTFALAPADSFVEFTVGFQEWWCRCGVSQWSCEGPAWPSMGDEDETLGWDIFAENWLLWSQIFHLP